MRGFGKYSFGRKDSLNFIKYETCKKNALHEPKYLNVVHRCSDYEKDLPRRFEEVSIISIYRRWQRIWWWQREGGLQHKPLKQLDSANPMDFVIATWLTLITMKILCILVIFDFTSSMQHCCVHHRLPVKYAKFHRCSNVIIRTS